MSNYVSKKLPAVTTSVSEQAPIKPPHQYNTNMARAILERARGFTPNQAQRAIIAQLEARASGMKSTVKNTYDTSAILGKLKDINPSIFFDFSYNQSFRIMTKDIDMYGRITGFNLDKNTIILDNEKEISFDDITNILPISITVTPNNTKHMTSYNINGIFSNNAYSTHLKNIIERCINNAEFKKCFKEEYGNNNALHELSYYVYEDAIKSFGETMDENLKRNLASAIRIMADKVPEGIKTKESLKELANKYYTPLFKGRFGGSRRKALRKSRRQRTERRRQKALRSTV